MRKVCPQCNSTNVITLTMDDDTKKSECQNEECGFLDATEKFPMGFYELPRPDLKKAISEWCDEMKVSKDGYFFKNALSMCEAIMGAQLHPWKEENKALKLLIEVIENNYDKNFFSQALIKVANGDDTIETEEGILILSFQELPEGCCDDGCPKCEDDISDEGGIELAPDFKMTMKDSITGEEKEMVEGEDYTIEETDTSNAGQGKL